MHGSAFHFAIEEYELSGRSLSVDDCKQLFFDHYDKAIAEALEKEPEYANWMTGGHKKGENDIADRRVKGQAKSTSTSTMQRLMQTSGGSTRSARKALVWSSSSTSSSAVSWSRVLLTKSASTQTAG